MSLQILIPVIAALAGAGMAGFSGELRHFVELKRERRKALNRMLWCQLDLWYEIKRSDVADGLQIISKKLAARLGVPVAAIASPEVLAQFAEILRENMLPKRSPELDSKYAFAVEELASYEPMLAYQLSGKTELQRHKEQSDAYVAAVAERFGADSEVDDISVGALSPFAREEVLRNAVHVIEEDIEDVADQLGRRTRKSVGRALSRLTDRLEADHEQRIDESVERLVTWATALAAANQTKMPELGPKETV